MDCVEGGVKRVTGYTNQLRDRLQPCRGALIGKEGWPKDEAGVKKGAGALGLGSFGVEACYLCDTGVQY